MANPVIGHFEKVRALAAGPRLLVVGGVRAAAASQVHVFDHVGNKHVSTAEVPSHVLGLALAGEQYAAACADGQVRVFAAQTGAPGRSIAAHAGACASVARAPDGDRLATAGADGYARLHSLSSGAKLREWKLSERPLRAVAVDPTGEYLAAAGDDGVVRVVTLANNAVREMPGHQGAVFALAFTPRDGRVASAGDDGVIRIWYVVGAVEAEVRGGDDAGHVGAVRALVFPPTPEAHGKDEPGDRLFSAGDDGKVKSWRMEDRRKPKTLEAGSAALHALAFVPQQKSSATKKSLGSVMAAGDGRTVYEVALDALGAPEDSLAQYQHGYQSVAAMFHAARPAREAAVATLALHDDPEALELLVQQLGKDREHEVRTLVAAELGKHRRRGARAALRERLDDDHPLVRAAALASLRAIDGEHALGPLRAALASKHPETRADALAALVALKDHSPLVPGMVADKLTDGNGAVRLAALDQLARLHPAGSTEPLRVAYERGPTDLKIEVLVRAARDGKASDPGLALVVARALDDADAGVRKFAFAARVLDRKALAAVLAEKDEDFGRSVTEIARRVVQLRKRDEGPGKEKEEAGKAKGPTDEELKAAREALPGHGKAGAEPEGDDLEPLLTALACRTPDTALRGARGLAQLGDTRALGALLQLSREADPQLRREAAKALQDLHDPRARQRLVWMLDDADASVRAAALDAFGKLEGAEPMHIANAALRSSHEDIRVRGLDRLVKVGAKGRAEAEALLGNALEDETPKVRDEAFRTLWAWHDKDPEKALDRALDARFPDLRLKAVRELETHAKEPWALERIQKSVADRDAAVAQAAYDAAVKHRGKADPQAHLSAMASEHASVRAAGAKGAAHAPLDVALRPALTKLLQDESADARTAALETLDKLLPNETGPHAAALQGSHLDLRVRAAELLAKRNDEHLIDPMRALLADKELFLKYPVQVLGPLRQRAASTLATLGSPRTYKYLHAELLKDEYADVREQAARGMANAARRGDEGPLLDALGHKEVWVRSWAGDGLSRLGDARALPVLTGNLRHEHLPIRIGAILSFAALGPDGFGGMLQGLEDGVREVQELVFAIVLARDLRAFRRGQPPELLSAALASARPEIRYAAARSLELRTDVELYLAHVIEVLTPPRPEKVGDMKDWPAEESRGRALVGLADALAGETPEQRYAAAQALQLRAKPVEYFREAARVAKPRSLSSPLVPDTTPRPHAETDAKPAKGWLRRLFSGDSQESPKGKAGASSGGDGEHAVSAPEQALLRRLAFGAYVGLLRQAGGDDEAHRVRRDAVDRIVELGLHSELGAAAAVPPVVRALDDGNYLVRRAALAGLKKLYGHDVDQALSLALASVSADVARAALDEFAARGEAAKPRISAALNSALPEVRRYAFELLEKLSPKASLEPLLAALGSDHADLRLGVLERLALSNDERVAAALGRAMGSEHEDLRLRAAELLVRRKDDRTADVLAPFLRADDKAQAARAREALVALGTAAALRAIVQRLEESEPGERASLAEALGRTRNPEAVAALAARFEDEDAGVRAAALSAALELAGTDKDPEAKRKRDSGLALAALRVAAHAKDAALRLAAANELDYGDEPEADALLLGLLGDRDRDVRVAAVGAYARRVVKKKAAAAPLEAILRAGTRELLLPAAEGVAEKGNALALRPLLLVARAGEEPERARALLALGTLGDLRALEELEASAAGGTEEAPVEPPLQAAAIEALGRIAGKITDPDARKRVVEKVEQASAEAGRAGVQEAAARGLRWIGGEGARLRLEALATSDGSGSVLRAEAARQLGELGDVASEAALAKALDDWNEEQYTAARKALDKLFPKDRVRVEFHAVGSKNDSVSGPAAVYLATQGDPRELVKRLGVLKDPALRKKLLYGLVRRGALPAAETAALLGSDAASAREEAAWLAGACADADAAQTADDKRTLGAALAAAEKRAAEKWKSLRGDEREAEARAWSRALWAAVRLGAAHAAPRARELLAAGPEASPAEVRREAVRALGRHGAAEDGKALTGALGDLDAGVRGAAARALAAREPAKAAALALAARPFDPVAFGPAAGGAKERSAAVGTHEGRAMALPAMLRAREVGPLVALATGKGGDEAARADAVAALGRAGGAEALAALSALARDKKDADVALRKAAYRALKRAKRAAERAKKFEATT